MDSPTTKSIKISQACAAAGQQFIPTGLPSNLLQIGLAIATEVQKLQMAQPIAPNALAQVSAMPTLNAAQRQHLNATALKVRSAHTKFVVRQHAL